MNWYCLSRDFGFDLLTFSKLNYEGDDEGEAIKEVEDRCWKYVTQEWLLSEEQVKQLVKEINNTINFKGKPY